MSYLDELETLLREREVPEERVRETVDDLAAFVAEGGVDPREEFVSVEEFADDLTGGTRVPRLEPRPWSGVLTPSRPRGG